MKDETLADEWQEEGESQKALERFQPDFETILKRPVTKEEIAYLLSLYPYVTIADDNRVYIDHQEKPEQIVLPNGWLMFVYESAICLGASYYEAQRYIHEQGIKGAGTFVKQGNDAVLHLLNYMRDVKGWETIRIVFGSRLLQRLTWVHCVGLNYRVTGFYPDEEDEEARVRIEKIKRRLLYPQRFNH